MAQGNILFTRDGWHIVLSKNSGPFSGAIRDNRAKDQSWHIVCEKCRINVQMICFRCRKKVPEDFGKKIDFFEKLMKYE